MQKVFCRNLECKHNERRTVFQDAGVCQIRTSNVKEITEGCSKFEMEDKKCKQIKSW